MYSSAMKLESNQAQSVPHLRSLTFNSDIADGHVKNECLDHRFEYSYSPVQVILHRQCNGFSDNQAHFSNMTIVSAHTHCAA